MNKLNLALDLLNEVDYDKLRNETPELISYVNALTDSLIELIDKVEHHNELRRAEQLTKYCNEVA